MSEEVMAHRIIIIGSALTPGSDVVFVLMVGYWWISISGETYRFCCHYNICHYFYTMKQHIRNRTIHRYNLYMAWITNIKKNIYLKFTQSHLEHQTKITQHNLQRNVKWLQKFKNKKTNSRHTFRGCFDELANLRGNDPKFVTSLYNLFCLGV